MATSPDLGLPFIAQSQGSPEVTHNEALLLLQALLVGVWGVQDTPPISPVDGDAYIVGEAPTGDWIGRENVVTIYRDGAWYFIPGDDDLGSPIVMGDRQTGLMVWNRDYNEPWVWLGNASPAAGWASYADALGGPFVRVAGDTMTGNLALTGVAASISLVSSSGGATITLSPVAGGSSITLSPAGGGATFSALAAPGSAATFDINAEGNVAATYFMRNFRDAAFSGAMQWVHSRGTRAAQSALITNDQTMRLVGTGWDGVSSNRNSVQITGLVVAGTPGPADFESALVFDVTPAASITLTEIMRVRHSAGLSLFSNVVIDQNRLFRTRAYTVATLPVAGTAGRHARVTDALAPAYGVAVAGGGAIAIPVFDNGAAWVCA